MNGKVFLDTNVLAYCFDHREPHKLALARAIVILLSLTGHPVISTQVLVELYNVLTKKMGLDGAAALRIVQSCAEFETVEHTKSLVESGIRASQTHQLSLWDGLIVAAADEASCSVLLTEDFNHGQVLEGVEIANPFATN